MASRRRVIGALAPRLSDFTGAQLFLQISTSQDVRTLAARFRIKPGLTNALKQVLPGTLAPSGDAVHFARLVVIEEQPGEDPHLMLGVIFDGPRSVAIDFLVASAARLDPVLAHCDGYSTGAAYVPAALRAFIKLHEVETRFLYPKYEWSAELIDHAVRLRQHFLALVRDWQLGGSLAALYPPFLQDFDDPSVPAPPQPAPSPAFDPHRTNTLNMVQPLKPGTLGEFVLRLKLAQFITDLGWDALSKLHTLHFARVSVIRGDAMLFASAYDGDLRQYIVDFGSRVGDQIDQLWGLTQGYPPLGCEKDPQGFVTWLEQGRYEAQQLHVGRFPATVLEIDASVRLREELRAFRASNPSYASHLGKRLRKFVRANQELLA